MNYRDYYNYENNNYNKPNYVHTTSSILDPYQGFIRGNMFSDLYNGYKLSKPISINPSNKQAEMLTTIDSLCFALIDLSLYLDIYPEDKEALELFNYYNDSHDKYVKEYEDNYGPLTQDTNVPNDYFSWILSPWPWEMENTMENGGR